MKCKLLALLTFFIFTSPVLGNDLKEIEAQIEKNKNIFPDKELYSRDEVLTLKETFERKAVLADKVLSEKKKSLEALELKILAHLEKMESLQKKIELSMKKDGDKSGSRNP